ncbi:MAG: penicillin-binding protein 2 [Opitutales bacterium]|nr:penicillin-binding protein 2 [Opitutales bacterium]
MDNQPKIEAFGKEKRKLGVFYFALLGMFLILSSALAYRQLILHSEYEQKAERQTLRRVIKPGARGDILDRNGKLLVGNKPRFSVVVYFNEIRGEFRKEYAQLKKYIKEHPESKEAKIPAAELSITARKRVLQRYVDYINSVLGSDFELDVRDFNRHFSERMLLPLPIIKDLDERQYAILAEKLPVDSPVQVYADSSRSYPYGEYAAHALGFVGSQMEIEDDGIPGETLRTYSFVAKKGRSGVEKQFDDILTGSSGMQIWVVDPKGFQYSLEQEILPKKGQTVSVSLDIDVQIAAEDAMAQRKGAVVVLDVKTGEILTMASKPTYDANLLSPFISNKVDMQIRERGAWLNRAIQGLYPPGSTFKILTSIAGLRAGTLDVKDTVNCMGAMLVGNRRFPCNKRSGHGYLDMAQSLEKSCNVYFYDEGLKAGIEAISDTARLFGLDKKTGVDLPNETSRSIVPDKEYKKKNLLGPWSSGDTANTSIGQGYLITTPLQMACVAASLARMQTRTKPSILHMPMRITDQKYHGGEPIPIDKSDYLEIVRGMVASVNTGTSRRAASDLVQIAAKSGTAQVRPQGRPLTLAWMVAFAPADNPEIAMAVVIEGEEPGDASGGKTAGPIVKAVMEKYFSNKPALVLGN